MRDDKRLVCAAISRGYAFDELSEDHLELFMLAKLQGLGHRRLTVFPEPVAKDNPSRLCPFSRFSRTD